MLEKEVTPAHDTTAPREPGFVRVQQAFAGHIRNPVDVAAPTGVEDRRMAIYRTLFFNNVSSLLEQGFPVLRQCLGKPDWERLIRQFLIEHRAQTPYFPELGQELLDYLSETRPPRPQDPPFLVELAHYEWVEAALHFSDEEASPSLADPNGDLLAGIPVISPLAWNLSYRFPVHRIGPDFQPREPDAEPTHLVVYRNRQDQVQFLKINVVTQRLLELLKEDCDRAGRECLATIARELEHPNPEQIVEAGRALLEDLRNRHIVLGTRRAGAPASGAAADS